jgi:polyisoprenoid-binding protein YceI
MKVYFDLAALTTLRVSILVNPLLLLRQTKINMEKTTWLLDPTHSEVEFKIRHMMMTNVSGTFHVISGSLTANEDFTDVNVRFTIDARSINTKSDQRDAHLKSGEFFDVEKHPEIIFECEHYSSKEGKVTGTLTMKGVTKPVSFDVEFSGTNKDPWGNTRAGFSMTGKINRKEWGLEWNAALESGGVLVSEEVKLNAEVQFVKQGDSKS